jgi:hypothetical protein
LTDAKESSMNTRPADTRDHSRSRTLTRSAIATLFTLTLAATSVGSAQANPAGAQSQLTPIVGQGSGLVIVSPTSALTNAFDARVEVNLHNTTPDTTFTVTRAIDTTADGARRSSVANPSTPGMPRSELTIDGSIHDLWL